jgi:hypothetical protein
MFILIRQIRKIAEISYAGATPVSVPVQQTREIIHPLSLKG